MLDDRTIISFLADNYPTHLSARGLWERAGGRVAEVTLAETPRDMWHELWRKARTGAAASPVDLLGEALQDFPYNGVLLVGLRELAAPERLKAAEAIIDHIDQSSGPLEEKAVVHLFSTFPARTPTEAFATLAPAMAGRLSETKRASLSATLTSILQSAGAGAMRLYSETVKSVAEGTTKALMTTMPGPG